jgi:NAD(P)-dependent dehydrogenase (short-subunit alcohol dehydrogenase family)
VKLTSTNEVENKAVAEHIKSVIGRLDVVIANAGERSLILSLFLDVRGANVAVAIRHRQRH